MESRIGTSSQKAPLSLNAPQPSSAPDGRGAGWTGEGRSCTRDQTSAVPTFSAYFREQRFRAFSKGLGLSISAHQVGTALEKPDADRKVFLRVFLELGQELSQRLGTGAQ